MAGIFDPESTKQAFSSAPAIISSRGFLCVRLGISVSLPPHFTDKKLRLKRQSGPQEIIRHVGQDLNLGFKLLMASCLTTIQDSLLPQTSQLTAKTTDSPSYRARGIQATRRGRRPGVPCLVSRLETSRLEKEGSSFCPSS